MPRTALLSERILAVLLSEPPVSQPVSESVLLWRRLALVVPATACHCQQLALSVRRWLRSAEVRLSQVGLEKAPLCYSKELADYEMAVMWTIGELSLEELMKIATAAQSGKLSVPPIAMTAVSSQLESPTAQILCHTTEASLICWTVSLAVIGEAAAKQASRKLRVLLLHC